MYELNHVSFPMVFTYPSMTLTPGRQISKWKFLSEKTGLTNAGAASGLSRTSGKTFWVAIYFEQGTEYPLIFAPYSPAVVFWHNTSMPKIDFIELNLL